MLFAIADIDVKLSRIVELVEGGWDGEEGLPEDNS
jgi:hypothetical protein